MKMKYVKNGMSKIIDIEMSKILNCCSNCAYSNNKEGKKEFWCCFQEDFVLWCGTCPNHQLLIYCESCKEEEITEE